MDDHTWKEGLRSLHRACFVRARGSGSYVLARLFLSEGVPRLQPSSKISFAAPFLGVFVSVVFNACPMYSPCDCFWVCVSCTLCISRRSCG